jgi:hypothetical protein
MPIPKEWGEEEKAEYVAQITDLREELDTFEADDGTEQQVARIYIDLDDIDPNVLSRFPIRFRASRHRSSSWMKWLKAIEHVGFKCMDDPNKLIGNWVHIREESVGDEINGEYREWIFPRPVALLTNEEAAQEVFETLPKAPAMGVGPLDLDTRVEIFQLYKSLSPLKGGEGIFKEQVAEMLPEGITPDEAWELAKAEAEE